MSSDCLSTSVTIEDDEDEDDEEEDWDFGSIVQNSFGFGWWDLDALDALFNQQ